MPAYPACQHTAFRVLPPFFPLPNCLASFFKSLFSALPVVAAASIILIKNKLQFTLNS